MYPICCNKVKKNNEERKNGTLNTPSFLSKKLFWVHCKYMLQVIFVHWLQLQLCVISVSEGGCWFQSHQVQVEGIWSIGRVLIPEESQPGSVHVCLCRILVTDYKSNCGLARVEELEKLSILTVERKSLCG